MAKMKKMVSDGLVFDRESKEGKTGMAIAKKWAVAQSYVSNCLLVVRALGEEAALYIKNEYSGTINLSPGALRKYAYYPEKSRLAILKADLKEGPPVDLDALEEEEDDEDDWGEDAEETATVQPDEAPKKDREIVKDEPVEEEGKGQTYSWTKNEKEITVLTAYLVCNYMPVSKARLGELMTEFGMHFRGDKVRDKAINSAISSLHKNNLIVAQKMAVDEDGVLEETYTIPTRYVSNFSASEKNKTYLRPFVRSMDLLTHPDVQQWVEDLEKLMGGVQQKQQKEKYDFFFIKLKTIEPLLAKKSLPAEEEEYLLKRMGEKFDASESQRVSMFRRAGPGLIRLENKSLVKAIEEAAPDLWGRAAEYSLGVRLREVNPHKFDPKYAGYKRSENKWGTYVAGVPIVRQQTRPGESPSAIKRTEVLSPGVYIEGHVWVKQGMSRALIETLSRGVYLGAQRGHGQGLCQLADFEHIGVTTEKGFHAVNFAVDEETQACREKALAFLERLGESKETPEAKPRTEVVYHKPFDPAVTAQAFGTAKAVASEYRNGK